MKNVIIIILIAIAVSVFVHDQLNASPAATQTWVKNYVSTNVTQSAATSNIITTASFSLAGSSAEAYRIMQTGGSNSVERASQSTVNAVYPVVSQIFDTCLEH